MQKIDLDGWRLLRYALFFSVYLLLMTVLMVIWFSEGFLDAWQNAKTLTVSQVNTALYVSLAVFICISFAVLLARFLFYFCGMLYRGRKPGVSVITYKTLFNPFNFLLFPSLLNRHGMACRARCLCSLILLILVYLLMLLII